MKGFTDRVFYCEQNDTLAHVMYITQELWALSTLRHHDATGAWAWIVDTTTRTYEQAYAMIVHTNPTLLVQDDAGWCS